MKKEVPEETMEETELEVDGAEVDGDDNTSTKKPYPNVLADWHSV